SFDANATKNTPGVRAVFPVPPLGFLDICGYGGRNLNTAGGVAVVAESTWAAIQGRNALKLNWDKGLGGSETTESLRSSLEQQATAPPTFIAVDRGDTSKALEVSPRSTARKVGGAVACCSDELDRQGTRVNSRYTC